MTTSALGTEQIPRLLLRFAWPAFVGTLAAALFNIVDRIFVGQWIGCDGIAAVSVTFPVMLILMAFGMLIAFGGTTLAAIHLGQNRCRKAEQVLGNALTLYLLLSAAFTLGGLALLAPLLHLAGAGPNILPLAEEYLGVLLLGALFHEISFGLNCFIRVDGRPRTAMLTLLIGGGLKLLVTPLCLLTFDGGLRGAALATVLAQGVSALWVMIYFLGGRSRLKLRAVNLRLRPELLRGIVRAGSPLCATALAASAVQALLNTRLHLHGGDEAIAVMGMILSISLLATLPISGITQGAQPILGYNFGAGNFRRVRQTLRFSILWATAVALVCFAVVETRPEPLLRMFYTEDRQLVSMGAGAMRIFLLMLPLLGLQAVGAGYFQSVNRPGIALALSLARQVLFLVPLLLILPRFYGLYGVWMAVPAAELLAALTTGWLLKKELRRLARAETSPPSPIGGAKFRTRRLSDYTSRSENLEA